MSNDEDAMMVDINAAEDPSDRATNGPPFTPEPRSTTASRSPVKDDKSSNRSHETEVATVSVDAEHDFHKSLPKTPTSPVIAAWIQISPVEKVSTQDYSSDPRKLEMLNTSDSSAIKKSSKA
jgi:hypothetical protein